MRSLILRRRRALPSVLSICLAGLITASSPAQTAPPRLAEPVPPVSPITAGVAVLIVDPPSGPNVMDSDALLQRRINTHAATIASEQHLRKVIAQAEGETRKTQWFKESDSPLERAQWLRDHLRVTVLPGTSLIQVALPDLPDPAERKTIVQAICQAYLESQRSQRTNELLDRTATLNTIRIKAESQLKILRADMREKMLRLNLDGGAVGGLGTRLGVKDMELSRLVQENIEAQLQLGKAQGTLKALAEATQQGQYPPQVDELMARMEPSLSQERSQLQQVETERDLLVEQNGADSARLKALTQRAEKMRAQYDKRFEESRTKARASILEQAEQEAKAAEAHQHALATRVENLKQDMGDLSNTLVQYDTLKREEQALIEKLRLTKEQIDNIMALQSSASAVEIRWHLYPEVTPVR
jgi:uncharacterized protein involved in exopolysaccharide biosynthesis